MSEDATEFANTWVERNVRSGESLRRESSEARELVIDMVFEAKRAGFTSGSDLSGFFGPGNLRDFSWNKGADDGEAFRC